jgi:hypothetical protein
VYVVPPPASMVNPVVFTCPLWHSVQLLSPGTPETPGGGPVMFARIATGMAERRVTHLAILIMEDLCMRKVKPSKFP